MRATNGVTSPSPALRAMRQRGFVLPYVMLIAVVLVAFAALTLTSAQDLAHGTASIEGKNATFDAAEAGLNAALEALNDSPLDILATHGTLSNGYSYDYSIYANLTGTLGDLIEDPILGNSTIDIPAASALIVSVGKGPNGERPSTVEAVVAVNAITVDFEKYAIIAGRNVQGSYQGGITDLGNGNSAAVHANGSINASISGALQGAASASGDTNTLPPGTTGASSVALPTVGQFDTLVSNFEDEVDLDRGSSDMYAGGGTALASAYSCPTPPPSDGCILFYDGPLVTSSEQTTFTGPWTFVINGDFTQSSEASLTFANQPGVLVVNGNASIEGSGLSNAYVEIKGSTLLGGAGTFTGAILTLGNFTFDNSDSSGPFQFDSGVVPPPKIITGRVKVVTYAEY
jgi:hypothetical protein